MYIRLVFWDHTESGPPTEFEISGRLVEDADDHYKIASWCYPGHDWTGDNLDNVHYYSILKTTIILEQILEPA